LHWLSPHIPVLKENLIKKKRKNKKKKKKKEKKRFFIPHGALQSIGQVTQSSPSAG
jgi:hypothetical protein